MRIQLLSEAKQHLPVIAQWLHDDWGALPPWADVMKVRQSLENRCSDQPCPKCFIAVSESDELLATASVKLNELSNHPDKKHWLGEVYVKHEFRGKGLGSLLTHTVTDYAFAQGVDRLFLYTPDQQNLYAKLGWHPIGSEQVNNERVSLMMLASPHLR